MEEDEGVNGSNESPSGETEIGVNNDQKQKLPDDGKPPPKPLVCSFDWSNALREKFFSFIDLHQHSGAKIKEQENKCIFCTYDWRAFFEEQNSPVLPQGKESEMTVDDQFARKRAPSIENIAEIKKLKCPSDDFQYASLEMDCQDPLMSQISPEAKEDSSPVAPHNSPEMERTIPACAFMNMPVPIEDIEFKSLIAPQTLEILQHILSVDTPIEEQPVEVTNEDHDSVKDFQPQNPPELMNTAIQKITSEEVQIQGIPDDVQDLESESESQIAPTSEEIIKRDTHKAEDDSFDNASDMPEQVEDMEFTIESINRELMDWMAMPKEDFSSVIYDGIKVPQHHNQETPDELQIAIENHLDLIDVFKEMVTSDTHFQADNSDMSAQNVPVQVEDVEFKSQIAPDTLEFIHRMLSVEIQKEDLVEAINDSVKESNPPELTSESQIASPSEETTKSARIQDEEPPGKPLSAQNVPLQVEDIEFKSQIAPDTLEFIHRMLSVEIQKEDHAEATNDSVKESNPPELTSESQIASPSEETTKSAHIQDEEPPGNPKPLGAQNVPVQVEDIEFKSQISPELLDFILSLFPENEKRDEIIQAIQDEEKGLHFFLVSQNLPEMKIMQEKSLQSLMHRIAQNVQAQKGESKIAELLEIQETEHSRDVTANNQEEKEFKTSIAPEIDFILQISRDTIKKRVEEIHALNEEEIVKDPQFPLPSHNPTELEAIQEITSKHEITQNDQVDQEIEFASQIVLEQISSQDVKKSDEQSDECFPSMPSPESMVATIQDSRDDITLKVEDSIVPELKETQNTLQRESQMALQLTSSESDEHIQAVQDERFPSMPPNSPESMVAPIQDSSRDGITLNEESIVPELKEAKISQNELQIEESQIVPQLSPERDEYISPESMEAIKKIISECFSRDGMQVKMEEKMGYAEFEKLIKLFLSHKMKKLYEIQAKIDSLDESFAPSMSDNPPEIETAVIEALDSSEVKNLERRIIEVKHLPGLSSIVTFPEKEAQKTEKEEKSSVEDKKPERIQTNDRISEELYIPKVLPKLEFVLEETDKDNSSDDEEDKSSKAGSAEKVEIDPLISAFKTLDQTFYVKATLQSKMNLLRELFTQDCMAENRVRTLIFVRDMKIIQRVMAFLKRSEFRNLADCLFPKHNLFSQEKVITKFVSQVRPILVLTPATRSEIDISKAQHIIFFDGHLDITSYKKQMISIARSGIKTRVTHFFCRIFHFTLIKQLSKLLKKVGLDGNNTLICDEDSEQSNEATQAQQPKCDKPLKIAEGTKSQPKANNSSANISPVGKKQPNWATEVMSAYDGTQLSQRRNREFIEASSSRKKSSFPIEKPNLSPSTQEEKQLNSPPDKSTISNENCMESNSSNDENVSAPDQPLNVMLPHGISKINDCMEYSTNKDKVQTEQSSTQSLDNNMRPNFPIKEITIFVGGDEFLVSAPCRRNMSLEESLEVGCNEVVGEDIKDPNYISKCESISSQTCSDSSPLKSENSPNLHVLNQATPQGDNALRGYIDLRSELSDCSIDLDLSSDSSESGNLREKTSPFRTHFAKELYLLRAIVHRTIDEIERNGTENELLYSAKRLMERLFSLAEDSECHHCWRCYEREQRQKSELNAAEIQTRSTDVRTLEDLVQRNNDQMQSDNAQIAISERGRAFFLGPGARRGVTRTSSQVSKHSDNTGSSSHRQP